MNLLDIRFKKVFLLYLVFVMLSLCACSNKKNEENVTEDDNSSLSNTSDVNMNDESATTGNNGDSIDNNDIVQSDTNVMGDSSEKPNVTVDNDSIDDNKEHVSTDYRHYIDLEILYQNPELPTGCESVSLTMILKYLGFDISKTEIAKKYLVKSGNNYVTGFVGNPFTASGQGSYAPGMTSTANQFLEAKKSDKFAKNITGISLEELFEYVKRDVPVLVWTTYDYSIRYSRDKKQGQIIEYNGIKYDWTNEEHCVVLAGYDKQKNTVTLYDPMNGIVTIDSAKYKELYEYMYSMAVVIE